MDHSNLPRKPKKNFKNSFKFPLTAAFLKIQTWNWGGNFNWKCLLKRDITAINHDILLEGFVNKIIGKSYRYWFICVDIFHVLKRPTLTSYYLTFNLINNNSFQKPTFFAQINYLQMCYILYYPTTKSFIS